MTAHTSVELRAIRAERRARWIWDMEICGTCGMARCNVLHREDREHAPEGPEYFLDIPFCEFVPSDRQAEPIPQGMRT